VIATLRAFARDVADAPEAMARMREQFDAVAPSSTNL